MTTPEQAFWDWFVTNEAALSASERDEERIYDEVLERLHRVNPLLSFEFGSPRHETRESTISADGFGEAFPVVTRLFAVAPSLPRWKVSTLRQPKGKLAEVWFGDLSVRDSEASIIARFYREMIEMDVYFTDHISSDEGELRHFICFMLWVILGEYDVTTRISTLNIWPASLGRNTSARPLNDLSHVVSSFGPPARVH